MMSNDETLELSNTRLRLRHGLEFELRESEGKVRCAIHDRLTGDFYEVGLAEYAMISLLDGRTRLSEAVSESAAHLGDDAIDQQEALSVFHWLVKTGLAESIDDTAQGLGTLERIRERDAQKRNATILGRLNLLCMKLPVGDPEHFLNWITPKFSWITGTTFFCFWLLVCAFAIVCAFLRFDTLPNSAAELIDSSSWMWMIACFLMLKAVHEIAHGIFCHYHGGRVKETGIVFILFVPLPYMDVTSCWGFASRWKRIAVSAAGMYVEWFIAALATIAWFFTSDPTIRFHLFNLMLAGCVSTLLFNANFLMRFDGYYIFSDLVDIPNLYARGQICVCTVAKRLFLGIDTEPSRESQRTRAIIGTFGMASLLWRVIVCSTIAIAASQMLYGFGLALAFIGITIWCTMPILNLLRFLLRSGNMQLKHWNRLARSSAAAVTASIVTCVYVPWPQQVYAPAVVAFAEPAVVRAETAGFVMRISVRDGDYVRSGDIIAVLRNDELIAEYETLILVHEESQLRGRQYYNDGEIATYQAELASRQSLQAEITEAQKKVEALTIRAPKSGTIHGQELGSRLGSFLRRGETFFEIIDDENKEILVAIDQHDFEIFNSCRDRVTFYPAGSISSTEGDLRAVDPAASTQIDPRLTASAGGALSLRINHESNRGDGQIATELVHPRFTGWVDLTKSESKNVRAGTTGRVYLNRYSHSIGSHLKRLASEWFIAQADRVKMR